MTTPTVDNSGVDPTLMSPTATANKYAGIGLAGSGSSGNAGGYSKSFFDFTRPKGGKPTVVSKRLAGQNGYYFNGPTFDPLNEAQSRYNAITAYTQSWAKPEKKDYIDRFGSLLNTYGNTNSAGVISSLAESGIDPSNPAAQSLLKADAAASAASYGTSKPAIADVVKQSDSEENWFQNLMDPVQGVARNAFSLLNAPFQTIDASVRTIGGGIAALVTGNEKAQQQWLESMNSGGPFFNQTDFGQTLKSIFFEPGTGNFDFDPWSAFNQYQAGLDVNRAYEALSQDPKYAEMLADPNKAGEVSKVAEKYAKEQNWYTEGGWFVEESSAIGEAQRQATYNAWAIPGPNNELTAWTLGRGIASATVGPDSSAYNAMSGLIDATWNIVGDPLTYAGAGLISKGIQYTGKAAGVAAKAATAGRVGTRLAEEGVKVGFVKRQWAEGVRNINTWNAKTVEQYNRIAVAEGLDEITPQQFIAMAAHEQGPVVSAVQKGRVTQDAIDKTVPNADVVANQAAAIRRQQSVIDKASGVVAAGEDSQALGASKQLYDDYLKRVLSYTPEGKALVNQDEVDRWVTENGPEAIGVIEQYVGNAKIWAARNPDQVGSNALNSYSKYVDSVIASGATRAAGKNADNAMADAVRASIDSPFDPVMLGDDLPMGTVASQFNPTGMMQGMRDGAATSMYWNGAVDAVIVGGDDLIDAPILESIGAKFEELLANPKLNRPAVDLLPEELDTLPGQVISHINKNSDARSVLTEVLSTPGVTYGQMLKVAQTLGLDGYLDNIIRDSGVDGIGEGVESGLKGVWFGEHPNIEAYRIPDDVADLGAQAVNSGDVEGFLAAMSKGDRADLGGMTATELSDFLFKMGNRYGENVAQAAEHDLTALEFARINAGKLDDTLRGIDAKFVDPEEAILEIMRHNAGMNGLNSMPTLDAAGVREFLFGNGPLSRLANHSLDTLANIVSDAQRAKILKADGSIDVVEYEKIGADVIGMIDRASKYKWTTDTVKGVFENSLRGGGVDGLLQTLAPRLGIDISQGSIAKTTAVLGTDGLRDFNTWHKAAPLTQRFLHNALKTPEYFGRLRPNSKAIAIANSPEVIDSMVEYAKWMKVDSKILDPLIGKIRLADGTIGAAAVNRNALKDLWNEMGSIAIKQLDDSKSPFFRTAQGQKRLNEMKTAMEESFKLWVTGKTGNSKSFEAEFFKGIGATDSAVEDLIMSDGAKIGFPSFLIESEIASGFISLPNVDEWMAATTRFGRALSSMPKGQDVYNASKRFYDNFFRTALLVGRVSYVLRNSAEMQVRMFLNGHQSVFNDPAALIGMAVSEFRGKPFKEDSFFGKSMDRFSNTVLDTKFVVGSDAQAAANNFIQDYFALIRQSHALTDARVYNSGVRQGWVGVTVDAPQFNKGWANELIMLHRSGIARTLLNMTSPTYAGKASAGNQYDNVVKFFMSDAPEAQKIRSIMQAGDEDFARIFQDPEALKQYLFTNPKSVMNKIKGYTMDDPSLIEFVKTGKFTHRGGMYDTNDTLDLQKGVNDFADALKSEYRGSNTTNESVRQWFGTNDIKVPYVEKGDLKNGNFLVNKFFDLANSFERLGSVGPEFRMAYWDEVASLAPMLNASDVDKALKSARTTLSPIKRLGADNIASRVGKTHPAFAALEKQKVSGMDGVLSLEEIHDMAMKTAASNVTDLFYDAARRNDMWAALRLLFPFGQAWGNTAKVWGELGAKNPIQVYKIDKVLNGLTESGSTAIYDYMDMIGAIPDYAPGGAPYNQDTDGGFFYQDKYGDTKFMLPFMGNLAGLPLKVWSTVAGVDAPGNIGIESPASSLNFAAGGDSLLPGVSFFGASALNLLPDNNVTATLKRQAAPFGSQNALEAMVAPWVQKLAGGAGSVPIVGGVLENAVGVFAPQTKNKYVTDAMSYLWSTGQYNLQDPKSVQRLNEDSKGLASALLLTNGLIQNVSPTTPQFDVGVDAGPMNADGIKDVQHYSLAMMNLLAKGYTARAGNDTSQGRTDMLVDFGPSAMFALVGDWKGMERTPTSEALQFAYKNPEVAKSYNGLFQYFFPNGDTSDVLAREWAEKNAKSPATRKSAGEVSEEVISWMIKVQRARLDSFLQAGTINDGQYDAAVEDLKKRYEGTVPAQVIFTMDKSEEMTKMRYMYDNESSIKNSKAGISFDMAWRFRQQALGQARSLTGDTHTGLSGKKVANIKAAYLADIDALIAQSPDFRLLGTKFKKEWS